MPHCDVCAAPATKLVTSDYGAGGNPAYGSFRAFCCDAHSDEVVSRLIAVGATWAVQPLSLQRSASPQSSPTNNTRTNLVPTANDVTLPQLDSDCSSFDFSKVTLSNGSHGSAFHGECCVVELSNRVAACVPEYRERFGVQPFDDDHSSIDRFLRRLFIGTNDRWLKSDGSPKWFAPENIQETLKGFAPRLLGTNTGDDDENRRRLMVVDWDARVAAPLWLDAAGMTAEAEEMRALPEIASFDQIESTRVIRSRIRSAAWALRDRKWDEYYEARRRVSGAAAVAEAEAVAAAAVAVAAVAAEAVAAAAVAVAAVAAEVAAAAVVRGRLLPVFSKHNRSAIALLGALVDLNRTGADWAVTEVHGAER